MALTVADNLRRCMERFGSTVASPARSRTMMQRPQLRYAMASTRPKAEPADEPKPAEPAAPAE